MTRQRYTLWRRYPGGTWTQFVSRDGTREWLWSNASRRAAETRKRGLEAELRPAKERKNRKLSADEVKAGRAAYRRILGLEAELRHIAEAENNPKISDDDTWDEQVAASLRVLESLVRGGRKSDVE